MLQNKRKQKKLEKKKRKALETEAAKTQAKKQKLGTEGADQGPDAGEGSRAPETVRKTAVCILPNLQNLERRKNSVGKKGKSCSPAERVKEGKMKGKSGEKKVKYWNKRKKRGEKRIRRERWKMREK